MPNFINKQKVMKAYFIILFTVFIFISCGDDSSTNNEVSRFDVTGEWLGVWQGGTNNGDVRVTFEQNGSEIRGSAIGNGNPCLNENTIWGVIDLETGYAEMLILDVNITEAEMLALNPAAPKETFQDMEHVIITNGFFTEDGHISLHYEVLEWTFCDGAIGTIDLDKS